MRLVQDDKRFVERPAAHEGKRRDLYDVFLHEFHNLVKTEHFIQGVIEGAQVGIDFLHQVAGQVAQFFPGLHSRPYQDQAPDAVLFQGHHCAGHGQVGLACAGRSYAETDIVIPDIVQV